MQINYKIKVHLMFLTLLEDFDVAGQYSLGGATLAWSYRVMCRGSKFNASKIGVHLYCYSYRHGISFPTLRHRD
jgi:hypothetical protein